MGARLSLRERLLVFVQCSGPGQSVTLAYIEPSRIGVQRTLIVASWWCRVVCAAIALHPKSVDGFTGTRIKHGRSLRILACGPWFSGLPVQHDVRISSGCYTFLRAPLPLISASGMERGEGMAR